MLSAAAAVCNASEATHPARTQRHWRHATGSVARSHLKDAISLGEDLLTVMMFDADNFPDVVVFFVFLIVPACDTFVGHLAEVTVCQWDDFAYELASEALQAYLYMLFCNFSPAATRVFITIAAVQMALVIAKFSHKCRDLSAQPLLGTACVKWSGFNTAKCGLSLSIQLFGAVFTFVPLVCTSGELWSVSEFKEACYTILLWTIPVVANAWIAAESDRFPLGDAVLNTNTNINTSPRSTAPSPTGSHWEISYSSCPPHSSSRSSTSRATSKPTRTSSRRCVRQSRSTAVWVTRPTGPPRPAP